MTAGARTLNLAIAGLGLAGSGMVAPAVAAMANVHLAAACDTNERALDDFAARYEARTYPTLEELCSDPGVDVIWIATPNLVHAPHAILAMEHGKHVIVE